MELILLELDSQTSTSGPGPVLNIKFDIVAYLGIDYPENVQIC